MKRQIFLIGVLLGCLFGFSAVSGAATGGELAAGAAATLNDLKFKVPSSAELLAKAKGLLIFPGTWKAGFGLGGEYGEGALKIGDKVVDYYNLAGISFGLQLGIQKKRIILAFMDDQVLAHFQNSDGWEFGIDGSIALVKIGFDGKIDSQTTNEPILVFVVGQKGLMYNLTLEGYKVTKIKKDY